MSPKYFSSQLSDSTGFAHVPLIMGKTIMRDSEPFSPGYDMMVAPRVSFPSTNHQDIPGLRLFLLQNSPKSIQGRSILSMYRENLEVELQAAMETGLCLQSSPFLWSLLLSEVVAKQPGDLPAKETSPCQICAWLHST